MKRYVEKTEEETTNVLSDWVGVALSDGSKCVILCIGKKYHIICNVLSDRHNDVCGGRKFDGDSPKDTIDKWKKDNCCLADICITDIYCFESYKELMQWFTADSITD